MEDWFKWARRQRVVIAMSGEVVYTPEGKAVALAEMMRRFPVEISGSGWDVGEVVRVVISIKQ
ncbi:MAG: hypothetical protein HWQ35_17820 [Nostoc sp. NMS1]|uniref:hypothetical protein n=1 Tax=Nostoc sp. NMS1 TaxID=2815388 RepID=UPI0025EF9D31|nr:hypothetical protein [Nostoc sp. NMS1]MBN3908325.1 hypothetical protein [Nostoc sp. NMS1]